MKTYLLGESCGHHRCLASTPECPNCGRTQGVYKHVLDNYQSWVLSKLKRQRTSLEGKACAALGMAGEAGEFADMIKKEVFHDKPADEIKKLLELGDTLFYVAANCIENGVMMSEVMERNYAKLNARYPNGFDSSRAHAPGEKPKEELDHSGGWPQSAGE